MNETTQKFCQSCGMPMGDTEDLYGTNADGSKTGNIVNIVWKKVPLRSRVRWKKWSKHVCPIWLPRIRK